MNAFHHAALPALGAAVLFGASTPLAKQLMGTELSVSGACLLAGLLYLGSGLGLFLVRLVRDKGLQRAGLARNEWPWLLSAVAFGGIAGPLLLMIGLSHSSAASASLLLNIESVLTALIAWLVFRENTDRRMVFAMLLRLKMWLLILAPK